jgi:hypothetical protein
LNGLELWKKYAGFFELDFPKQHEYSKRELQDYFQKWKEKGLGRMFGLKGDIRFEDVPLTAHSDYQHLHEFGARIRVMDKQTPYRKDELLWDRYERMGRQAQASISDTLPDEYGVCAKTTGTTGQSKWTIHGKKFMENLKEIMIVSILLAASEKQGQPKIGERAKLLILHAPAPYFSGWAVRSMVPHFEIVPPVAVTDRVTNLRRKMFYLLKEVERGSRIDVALGVSSFFHLMCRYFTDPENLYSEMYRSMPWGARKLALYFLRLKVQMSKTPPRSLRDILPLKGLICGGADTRLYADYFRENLGVEPINGYGSTELGAAMMGTLENRLDLIPVMKNIYCEFLSKDGQIHGVDGVKRDEVYELVATPFWSSVIRYKTGDLFRVVDSRDDGMPVFAYESRSVNVLNLYQYVTISEAIAAKTLEQAGLTLSDRWAWTMLSEPQDHIYILMEKAWDLNEEVVAKRIFESLQNISNDFTNLVKDLSIRKATDLVSVEYLKEGAFLRYSLRMAREGTPIGQMKPPKIIPVSRKEIVDRLRD